MAIIEYDIETGVDVEATDAEARAVARLSKGSDFDLLVSLLERWLMRDMDALMTQRSDQELELIRTQGKRDLLKKMVQLVRTNQPQKAAKN